MLTFLDPRGGLAPFGRIRKRWSTDFDGGTTLDDWLTLGSSGDDAGSSSAASTLAPGGIRLITGTTSGDTATLYGDTISLSASNGPTAVRLDVAYHTSGTWSDARVAYGFEGTASGGWTQGDAGTTSLALVGRATGPTDTSETVNYEAHEGGKRYVVSLVLTTTDKSLFLLANDRVMVFHTFGSAIDLNNVKPFVRAETLTGAARELTVHQLAVERWWR